MKALTLWQPWASAIGRVKFIETRSWRTKYRGELAIHAAARTPPGYEHYFAALAEQTGVTDPPAGAIVSIARLVDVVLVEELISPSLIAARQPISSRERFWGDYSPGRYGWILEDVRHLATPAPANGRQLLWEWDVGTPTEEYLHK